MTSRTMISYGDNIAEGRDETRRLLYMALLRPRTKKYELAGTLVNALAHHHPDGTSASEIAGHLVSVIEDANPESVAWLNKQIRRLTAELDGDGK